MTSADNTGLPLLNFDTDGELLITASPDSSKDDFDFLEGHHKVHHKRLKERLNKCTEWIEFEGTQEMKKHLTGIANVEIHHMSTTAGTSAEGMALRLFNPKTRLWSIYWADNTHGTLDTPVIGSFENNSGHFFAKDRFNDKAIVIGFNWDISDRDNPVWSQAFSDDKGITWEWNWFMYFTKIK
jgi:hypothetical protein